MTPSTTGGSTPAEADPTRLSDADEAFVVFTMSEVGKATAPKTSEVFRAGFLAATPPKAEPQGVGDAGGAMPALYAAADRARNEHLQRDPNDQIGALAAAVDAALATAPPAPGMAALLTLTATWRAEAKQALEYAENGRTIDNSDRSAAEGSAEAKETCADELEALTASPGGAGGGELREALRQVEILERASAVSIPDNDADFDIEKARRGARSWAEIARNAALAMRAALATQQPPSKVEAE